MTVLYFIKYFQDGFMRYFDKISRCNAIIVFDVEDSIRDKEDPENNRIIKQKYRNILQTVLKENPSIHEDHEIGIRVNDIGSDEFKRDVSLLSELDDVQWKTIILPKVNKRADIESFATVLDNEGIRYDSLTILIETVEGMNNLKDIISPAIPTLDYLIFGHADFNIDSGIFPFTQHNHEEYWSWVNQVQEALVESSITYINSPCLYLGDHKLFKYNLERLHNTSKVKYGQMTLTSKQTSMCNTFSPDPGSTLSAICEKPDALAHAKHVMDYVNRKPGDKSFAIDDNRYLMSPHEIIMAKSILDSTN